MIIKYQLTEPEVLKALRFTSRTLSKRGKIYIICYNILGIIFTAVGAALLLIELYLSFISPELPAVAPYALASLFHRSFPIIMGSVLLFFGIIYLLKAYQFPNGYYKKRFKKKENQAIFLKHSLEFKEDGLNITSSNQDYSFVGWSSFNRILQIQGFFLLEIQEDNFLMIPKSQLSSESTTYIDQNLQEHFKDRYIVMQS